VPRAAAPARRPARGRARTQGGILDFLAHPPDPVPPLVVLYGKEHQLADDAVRAIVESAIPDASLRDLNVDSLGADASTRPAEIAAKAAVLPFLAERRVVIVRGTIDLKKEARDAIAGACRDIPPHAVVVVDHSGKPARPQGRKPKDEASAIAAQTKGSLLLDCTLDAAGCAAFIDSYLPQTGAAIDADAREMLAATQSVAEIKNALERLALTTKRIKLADVREYAVAPQDLKLWDLGDAVNGRDLPRALRIAKEMDEGAGPLTWLAGDAQILWELATGATVDEIARATGQNAWRIGKLGYAAKKLSPAAARRNVDITARALERCITGKREWGQALEEVIVRMCDGAR
jgi:DNA polymerase III delta subunit